MFKWARQMKMSLATKCQMLFGVAVVLVIAAALFVPWQRMEQLAQQPNVSAAAVLAEASLHDHVDFYTRATTHPALLQLVTPTTLPTAGDFEDRPRILKIQRVDQPELTRYESNSIKEFIRNPDRKNRIKPNGDRFLYTQPLFAQGACLQCHSNNTVIPMLPDARPPTSRPVDSPQLIGIASINIPSQTSGQAALLNRVFLLVAGLLAGALAGVTMYLIITRIILQPVRVLQETAEKVSAGDLNIRSHIASGDEFQQLSETFNTMLVNLKHSTDLLSEANKSLDLRLGQVAETNVALFESNRLKSEFLANVSHELRTPLNSILGFADLLRESMTTVNEKQTRYLQNIIRSGHNLLDLINDLLDLAKIEAGRMEIRAVPLSLNDVLEGLIMLLRPLFEPRSLTVTHEIIGDLPIVTTDAARLQQILYNFLSNAIKFSPPHETIQVVAQTVDESHVRISIIDHGPGIPDDKQAELFQKFRQLDQSHTRVHGGTGLGLAIAKELSRLLGGTIGVTSSLGQGATFWVELPITIESGEKDVRGNE